jgi:hypothetical protein
MRPKLNLLIFINLISLNFIFCQSTNFSAYAGIGQNLDSEVIPSFFVGISHKIKIKFLQFEFGINLIHHKKLSTSPSIFEIPVQIGQLFLITKLITEEISTLEYSSFPIGIALNSKKNFCFGIGIQPMLLINQSRKKNLKYINIINTLVDTETSYEKIKFSPYNLELYSYINVPISNKLNILIKYSKGLIQIKEKRIVGGYVGTRIDKTNTRRISLGLSYSIRS